MITISDDLFSPGE